MTLSGKGKPANCCGVASGVQPFDFLQHHDQVLPFWCLATSNYQLASSQLGTSSMARQASGRRFRLAR
jgi:hypothetical protein